MNNSLQFVKLYHRWKNSKMGYDTTKLGLIGHIILYLTPGFALLIFVPSILIMIFEGWPYDVSVYYAFVTLTTIGFGDIVAGIKQYFKIFKRIFIVTLYRRSCR